MKKSPTGSAFAHCPLKKKSATTTKEIRRDRFLLGTKCGRYDVDQFDFSAGRVTRSVDESLRRMGLDYLDIIQCHDIEFDDLQQVVDEALPALVVL